MKRVLIVSYDFPPTGGPGVQRVAKFAKYLPRHGWDPVVLTTRRGRPIPKDYALLRELSHVEIHRTPAPHPHRMAAALKRVLGIRSNPERFIADLFGARRRPWSPVAWIVPDGKLIWMPFGLAWALTRPPAARADIVLSSLPMPSTAILGDRIARAWHVPHVIDYRDPWTGAFYMPSRWPPLRRFEAGWERRLVSRASAVVAVPGVPESLPEVDVPVTVIDNGYDEADFIGVEPRRISGGFVIAHLGLLWKERGLDPLVAAFRRLGSARPELLERAHFVQAGRFDAHVARQLDQLAREIGVTRLATLTHREAIACMLGADLLYLPTGHDHVPGKTYEYLRSGRPILGLAARESHLQRLLNETGGGAVIDRDDTAAIARYIEALMDDPNDYRRSKLAAIARYSREALTASLAQVLDGILARTD